MRDQRRSLRMGWLLPGLGLLLGLGFASPARAGCGECNLLSRECRKAAVLEFKLCKVECRAEHAGDPVAREACFLLCEEIAMGHRAECMAERDGCRAPCEEGEGSPCTAACAEPVRDCIGVVRDGKRGCMDSCRETAALDRKACHDQLTSGFGQCLGTVGRALGGCLHGCAVEAHDGVKICVEANNACVRACKGGGPPAP